MLVRAVKQGILIHVLAINMRGIARLFLEKR